jgi:outer membrane protein
VFQASKQVIKSAQAQVASAEIALNGVREEAKVGQRTTLDVLNAQQTLLNARVSLVTAQRDQVVGSYALQAATGRLSVAALGVKTQQYDPATHFGQVKDKWFGLRTPDGQ